MAVFIGEIMSVTESSKKEKNLGAEVDKDIKLEEIAKELRKNITRPVKELIAIFKSGIVPYLFKNEDEYNEFIKLLQDFLEADRKDCAIFLKRMADSYPEQFDKLLLLIVTKKSTKEFRNCVDYLDGKDVFVENYFIAPSGYKYVSLAATSEVYKRKPKKGEISEFSIELNEREMFFVSNYDFYRLFLTSIDVIYAAKDERYISAILYNLKSYEEFEASALSKNEASASSKNEVSSACRRMLGMIVPYLDLNTLTLSMLNTYVERLANSPYEKPYLKELKLLLGLVKKISSKIGIKCDEKEMSFVLPSSVNFSRKGIEGVVVDANKMKKEGEADVPKIDITHEDVVQKAEDYIEFVEMSEMLTKYHLFRALGIDGEDVGIKKIFQSINFRRKRNLEIFYNVMKQRIKLASPNLDENTLQTQLRSYMLPIVKLLYKNKLIDIDGIKRLDEVVAISMVITGDIIIDNEKLGSAGFSQNALAHICLYKPERIEYCLENDLVSQEIILEEGFKLRDEYLRNLSLRETGAVEEHFMVSVIEELFKCKQMSIEKLSSLVVDKKITADEFEEIQLSKEILDEQDFVEKLSRLYLDIDAKRVEYENAVRTKIEQDELQGIKADDVTLGEKEIQLREELQVLIDRKRVYLACLEKVNMTEEERNSFLKNLLDEVFEKSDYLLACHLIGEMYKDKIIDINFIVEQELSDIIVELIKSSVVTPQDMKKYKDSLISEDEKSLLRELCNSDGGIYENELASETLERLKPLIKLIINDNELNFMKKYMIIYRLCYNEDIELENEFLAECRNAILAENVEELFKLVKGKYKNREGKKVKSESAEKDVKTKEDDANVKTNTKKKHMYPEMALIDFMMLVDPEVIITGYEDGNVIIESKKLNRVVCENMWVNRGGKIERSYGVATFIVNFDKFKENESKVIVPGKKGHRINSVELYKCLPEIGTAERAKRKGKAIHYKDLDNKGKRKIYFDYLLYELGINLEDIRGGQDSRYSLEDVGKIEEYINKMRHFPWER